MKNIEDIEPEKFGCFYYSKLKGDVVVNILSPNGFTEYQGYEIFDCSNGTVIAFKNFNPQSTDYAYSAKSGDEEEIVQFQIYENIKDVLEETDSHNNSYYVIFGSRPVLSRINPEEESIVPIEERCDTHIYGASPFFELTDGQSGGVFNTSNVNFANIQKIIPILAIQGEACIMRITMKESDGSYRNYPGVTAIAKTLLGALRMSCEWRYFTNEPFNNSEVPALKISSFITKLGITEEIEQDIRSAQGPMHVERFIIDPDNARNEILENGIMPSSLSGLIKSKIRYRSLASLDKNTEFVCSEDLLNKEISAINSAIYSFCLNNNVNFEAFSNFEDITTHIRSISFQNNKESVIDIYELIEKAKSL